MNKWKWLKEYLQKNNISQVEVAEAMLWQKTRVSELLSGKRDFPVNKVLLAAEFFGLDLEEFTKYNSGFSKNIPSFNNEKRLPSAMVSVEVIDANSPTTQQMMSKNFLLLISKNSADYLKIVVARGDDMSPTFSDGDMLWVDTSKNSLAVDGIYLFEVKKEMFTKRICMNKIEGGANIISDNRLYPPMYIKNLDKISIIGKIVSVTKAI